MIEDKEEDFVCLGVKVLPFVKEGALASMKELSTNEIGKK